MSGNLPKIQSHNKENRKINQLLIKKMFKKKMIKIKKIEIIINLGCKMQKINQVLFKKERDLKKVRGKNL